jgi:hypothetical protein
MKNTTKHGVQPESNALILNVQQQTKVYVQYAILMHIESAQKKR